MTEQETMQIEWVCEKLVRQFVNYSDKYEYAKMCALFTHDAIFVRPSAPDQEIKGRDVILEAFKKRPQMIIMHMISNHVVEVLSATEATGYSYISFQGATNVDDPLPLTAGQTLFGEFVDRYVRTEAGWRIAERRGKLLLKGA